MTGRLIDADAIYKTLESCEIKKDTYGSLLNDWDHGYNCGIERAESEIECAQTVDAEPVIHAKWVKYYAYEDRYFCSACQDIWRSDRIKNMKYCPSCGAKMDVEEKENE